MKRINLVFSGKNTYILHIILKLWQEAQLIKSKYNLHKLLRLYRNAWRKKP